MGSPTGRVDVEQTEEIAAGYLNSRETLRFETASLSTDRIDRILDVMEAYHLRAIEGCTLGLLRTRRSEEVTECRVLGVWDALAFQEKEETASERKRTRRWIIRPGLLARSGEADHGVFTLTAEVESASESGFRWRIEARVEGYPSRFLRKPRTSSGATGQGRIGRAYFAFHRRVTLRFLHQVARKIERGEIG